MRLRIRFTYPDEASHSLVKAFILKPETAIYTDRTLELCTDPHVKYHQPT
jgi:hypothetical protein